MNVKTFLYTHPIFRFEEFQDWKQNQGPLEASSIHSSLNYCIETNKIKRLRRELYGVIPPDEAPDTVMFDPYLIASKTSDDSILAYHTALELLGVAYSTFGQFTFLTSRKVKPFEIDSQWYQPVLTPKTLRNSNQENFGIQQINRQGIEIKVTNVSRTFVDAIDRPDLCGGWEEVYRSVCNMAVLNFEEILQYCILRKNATLCAKVGFFLGLREGAFEVPLNILEQLQELSPKSPQYMGDKDKEKHKLIQKWNLLVPMSVLNQSWDEPNYAV